jgi:ABC-type Fe3+/spermidine/putrescine transport system ATPase subunit
MSVFDNVAYGLRVRKESAGEVADKVGWALGLVRMGEYARRSATKLSGGQQQRIALARAIAFSPAVLLLDEPLSNLDARLRTEMRGEIRDLQQRLGITAVYVTHDQEEALAISDRVVVMRHGRIEQAGDPADIYDRPRSAFVADFVGSANLISGRVRRDGDLVALETWSGEIVFGMGDAGAATEGTMAIRPTYPLLSLARPSGERNVWPVRIARRVFLGDFIEYHLDWAGAPFVVRRLPADRFAEGAEAYLSVDPQHCVLTVDDRELSKRGSDSARV